MSKTPPPPRAETPEPKAIKVFVVSPIGTRGTEVYKRALMVLQYVIRPAVKEALGVEAKRADDDNRPGIITHHIMRDLNDADVVIANLTGLNPNVMYELGLAHALAKPVIHLADKSTVLPFDNQDYRTVFLDIDDPNSHEEAKAKLIQQIMETQKEGYERVNPFTVAVKLAHKSDLKISDAALLSQMQDNIIFVMRQIESLWATVELRTGGHPSSGLSALFAAALRADNRSYPSAADAGFSSGGLMGVAPFDPKGAGGLFDRGGDEFPPASREGS